MKVLLHLRSSYGEWLSLSTSRCHLTFQFSFNLLICRDAFYIFRATVGNTFVAESLIGTSGNVGVTHCHTHLPSAAPPLQCHTLHSQTPVYGVSECPYFQPVEFLLSQDRASLTPCVLLQRCSRSAPSSWNHPSSCPMDSVGSVLGSWRGSSSEGWEIMVLGRGCRSAGRETSTREKGRARPEAHRMQFTGSIQAVGLNFHSSLLGRKWPCGGMVSFLPQIFLIEVKVLTKNSIFFFQSNQSLEGISDSISAINFSWPHSVCTRYFRRS